jgi:putative transposase
MHRRKLQRHDVPGTARYLTFSCHRRLPLLNHPAIRNRFVAHLLRATGETDLRILAWVVMPEHVHLISFHPIRPA